jgi:hypothetical protein
MPPLRREAAPLLDPRRFGLLCAAIALCGVAVGFGLATIAMWRTGPGHAGACATWAMPAHPTWPHMMRAAPAAERPAFIGVEVHSLDAWRARALDVPGRAGGALVTELFDGYPAKSAGLETGDVISMVDGEAVTGARHLVSLISRQRPGTPVALVVLRHGDRHMYEITTTAWPAELPLPDAD